MTAPKHTPGPWEADGLSVLARAKNHPNFTMVAGHTPIWVATMIAGCPESEDYANAHLIAAAPDLLEACKAGMAAYNQGNPNWSVVVNALADAVRKAEGGAA